MWSLRCGAARSCPHPQQRRQGGQQRQHGEGNHRAAAGGRHAGHGGPAARLTPVRQVAGQPQRGEPAQDQQHGQGAQQLSTLGGVHAVAAQQCREQEEQRGQQVNISAAR